MKLWTWLTVNRCEMLKALAMLALAIGAAVVAWWWLY